VIAVTNLFDLFGALPHVGLLARRAAYRAKADSLCSSRVIPDVTYRRLQRPGSHEKRGNVSAVTGLWAR
jgi:hypothetical protein